MRVLLIALFFLPVTVNADWALEQSDEGHWISTKNRAQHQFVASHDQGTTNFLLILTVPESMTTVPSRVNLSIDQGPGIATRLTLLKKRPGNMAFRLELDDTQKDVLIAQLVSGLTLEADFGKQQSTRFSLMGYTAAFSDLLIANEIGWIDPFWLTTNGKQQELACYQMATLSVQAIKSRKRGKNSTDTLSTLSKYENLVIQNALTDIVSWAYKIPEGDLPRIPVSRKYGIFKRCMARK